MNVLTKIWEWPSTVRERWRCGFRVFRFWRKHRLHNLEVLRGMYIRALETGGELQLPPGTVRLQIDDGPIFVPGGSAHVYGHKNKTRIRVLP